MLIVTLGEDDAIEVLTFPETELGRFPPRVDLVVIVRNPSVLQNYHGPLSFFIHLFMRLLIFLEFKGPTDAVDAGIFKRLNGHIGHYSDQQGLSWREWLHDTMAIAVVARGGQKVLDDWQKSGVKYESPISGVHMVRDPRPCVLVDLETLPPTADTAPLLLLAPTRPLVDVLQQLFKHDALHKYLKVAYWLHPREVKEMAKSLQVPVEPDIKTAVELLGLARVIEEMGVMTVLKEVGRSPDLQQQIIADSSVDDAIKKQLLKLLQQLK